MNSPNSLTNVLPGFDTKHFLKKASFFHTFITSYFTFFSQVYLSFKSFFSYKLIELFFTFFTFFYAFYFFFPWFFFTFSQIPHFFLQIHVISPHIYYFFTCLFLFFRNLLRFSFFHFFHIFSLLHKYIASFTTIN